MRIMDFDINLHALEKVKFGDTKEGTFAIRLAAGLEEPQKKSPPKPPRTGMMITSEGGKGEANTWGKRANWVDYAGELDGEKLGIAIFDNPANPKHPTYWHSRSYGLFAANIFGEHDFYNDKSRNGSRHPRTGQYSAIPLPCGHPSGRLSERQHRRDVQEVHRRQVAGLSGSGRSLWLVLQSAGIAGIASKRRSSATANLAKPWGRSGKRWSGFSGSRRVHSGTRSE